MKNSIFIPFFLICLFDIAYAENLFIQSKKISIDKEREVSIFEDDVFAKTENDNTIKSDYAEYDKKKGIIIFKNNVIAFDSKNNIIETSFAEYNELNKIFKSKGFTKITTSENYVINGEDIFDNKLGVINSNKKTEIKDTDNNKISLDNFEYLTKNNIFKSIGFIEIEDNEKNKSEFSQIYIDTKKKEILGTDIKAFVNQEDFKINKKNKPRIFANTMRVNKEKNIFNKSIFTLCDYRKNNKCPPWTIQSTEMLHNKKTKTIFHKNAVIKVYDIPIFYLPKLSHPDPTVDRRSGFLPPSFSDTQNLGSSISVPYFWAMGKDKDFTITSKLFLNENHLFMGEYRQAFEQSNAVFDFGYTQGYKETSATKNSGGKSHFFGEFTKIFSNNDKSDTNLKIKTQNVSDDKYLKLYRIKSDIVDYNQNNIENSLSFSHESSNYFLGLDTSVYETLKENYNDKYEYILPEITFDRNLLSNNFLGNIDLQSNFKIHNYDTNKTTKFLVNDFDWNLRSYNFNSGIQSKLLGKIKNVNYSAKNIENLKGETTNELYGAVGYLSEINLQKGDKDGLLHFLKPKILLRYAPGQMRRELEGSRLKPDSIFSLDRLSNINNFESGLSATIGFDYNFISDDKELNFSGGQIISEKENKNMPDITSLNEKLSDFVGAVNFKIKENFGINYDFSIDQNFDETNFNEISTFINTDLVKFDFGYLEEKNILEIKNTSKLKLTLLKVKTENFHSKLKEI